MKDFKQKYKSILDLANLSEDECKTIKNNIKYKSNKNIILQFKFCHIVLICLIVILPLLGITYASINLKHFKIESKDNKSIEESTKKSIYSDAIFDGNVSADIFVKDEYYSYEEIEKKLNLKLLKSNLIDSELFHLVNLETNNNNLAKANFALVNNDKSDRTLKVEFGFSICTQYASDKTELYIAGITKYENYFIKSLKTEAIIVKEKNHSSGFIVANFAYNNITYEVVLATADYNDNYLYEILESFVY
jgi:hypothetical protein